MAQIVVINSINPASGKTLIAAHLAVMLAKDYKAAVLDCGAGHSDLAMFVARRYALNLKQDYKLPVPNYHTLESSSFQEICEKYDVVILDSPSEKFYKYADVWITPLRGREGVEAVTDKNNPYLELIWQAKKQRASNGKSAFRWIVVPNDDFLQNDENRMTEMGKIMGYKVAPRLGFRPEYTAGMASGTTVLDKDLPALKTLFELPDLYARRNLKKLAEFIWRKE